MAPAHPESLQLEVAKPVDREISGKNSDAYEVALEANQAAAITVEQRGIDVAISLQSLDGKVATEFDSEPRIQGTEHVLIVAESAGRYHFSIKPKYSRAPAGHYQIQVTEIRPATEHDHLLFEAHKLSFQAQNLNDSGKFEDARKLDATAVEDAEKAVGPNDAYVGELLVKLADLERTADNRPKAEELYLRAIAVSQAALGRENPQTAFAIQRLGVLYNWNDDYARAEPLLHESLAITERTLGPDHPRAVTNHSDLAVWYSNRYDYTNALRELQTAQASAEKSIEPDDFLQILIINNIGNTYRLIGDYDRAEPMIQRVLQMVEKKYGPDYPRLSTPLMNLGNMERKKKHYDLSLRYLWRAEAIREKSYGAKNSETARSLITIGNTYRASGEYPKAIEVYKRSEDMLKTVAGPYDVLLLLTYVNFATTYAAMGDMSRAVEYQTLSDSMLEKSIDLNLAIGSERQRFEYLSEDSERTDRTISFGALLAPDNPTARDLAALVVLQRKGRVLDAMSGSFATFRERLSTQDQVLLDELDKTTAQLAKLSLQGPGKTPLEEYQKQLATLGEQREKLEADIGHRSAEFRTHAQPVTLDAVKSAIPAQAALIEFISYHPFTPKDDEEDTAFGESHYLAYIFRQHGDVQWKELGPAKPIDAAVTAFRSALRDPARKDAAQLARALDKLIMQPVRDLTGDATQLLISPDGVLNLVPFEALLDEHDKYLLERYSISYLTTGRDLLRMQASRASKSAPVVIADPLFGEPPQAQVASTRSPKTRSAQQLSARRSVTSAKDLTDVYFSPLTGTALEARAIKSEFPESKLLTGQQATETAVKQVEAPSILHIATHGFFLVDENQPENSKTSTKDPRGIHANSTLENPLLRSGLALAGANLKHTGTDKGILTALEASNLNLWGTKLVTLSACDTGVGQIRNLEGVYGLRRAFVLAGAESVVMSLWPISDYATREMMTSYYAGLKKGLGRGEALRQTKLAMMKRKGRQHPFYWASFIQSGEWANLEGQR